MKKLTYTKIVNSAIEIDLYDGYSVIAVSLTNRNSNKFCISFYLRNNNTNVVIPIEELENIEFDVDIKRLNAELLKYTANLLNAGYLDEFIEKYNQSVIEAFHEYHKTLKDGEFNV